MWLARILGRTYTGTSLIHSRLFDLPDEAKNMDFIFHDMINSYFSARETLAYFQSKYLRQAQPMPGPLPSLQDGGGEFYQFQRSTISRCGGSTAICCRCRIIWVCKFLTARWSRLGVERRLVMHWLTLGDVIYYPELLIEVTSVYSLCQSRTYVLSVST